MKVPAKHLARLQRVINSCETFEQLEVAVGYCRLMARKLRANKEIGHFAGHLVFRRAWALDPVRAMLEDWRVKGRIPFESQGGV